MPFGGKLAPTPSTRSSRATVAPSPTTSEFIPSLLQQLQAEALQLEGGHLQQFYAVWETLTSDPEILQLVRGAHLELDDTEFPSSSSTQPHLNKSEMAIMDAEIVQLSLEKVISKCEHSPDLYLSAVFTRPKKDGINRMIHLKGVNSEITYHHFKMDTLQVALKLVTPFCFMAKGDYDSPVSITISARIELHCWVDEVTTASNDTTPSDPDITVASDASMSGGGGGGGLSGRSLRGPVATS